MIATMVMNMPKSNSERQTTLVVVPAALLQQVSQTCVLLMPLTYVGFGIVER